MCEHRRRRLVAPSGIDKSGAQPKARRQSGRRCRVCAAEVGQVENPVGASYLWRMNETQGGMDRAEIIARIRARAEVVKALGATALYIYGSRAREEARDMVGVFRPHRVRIARTRGGASGQRSRCFCRLRPRPLRLRRVDRAGGDAFARAGRRGPARNARRVASPDQGSHRARGRARALATMKDDLIPLHDILTEIAFLRSIRGRGYARNLQAKSR